MAGPVILVVALLAAPGGAGAQDAPGGAGTTTSSRVLATTTTGPTTTVRPPTVIAASGRDGGTARVEDDRTDPDLSSIVVEGREVEAALARHRADTEALELARHAEAEAVTLLAELVAAEQRLAGTRTQAERRGEKSAGRLVALRESVLNVVVENYIRGASASPIDIEFNADETNKLRTKRVHLDSVRDQRLAEVRDNQAVVAQMDLVIAQTGAELTDVHNRQGATTAARDRSVADQARLTAQVAADGVEAADARLTSKVKAADFVFVALDAYYKAAKRLAAEKPDCRIRWTLLAAISRTEGNHGTFGGAKLRPDGTVDKPIIGIALDGDANTARIGDSDGGAYDADPDLDRAVGPMQFLPSTWVRWARDGNGDGRADPQNLYDAALAAAGYLCVYGPGLDTVAGIDRAVIHYNVDNAYVDLVHSRTRAYDELRIGPAPPPEVCIPADPATTATTVTPPAATRSTTGGAGPPPRLNC